MGLIGSLLDEESAPVFGKSTQTATEGQTVFSAGFDINEVFVENVLRTSGYSGGGTGTITFDAGLPEGYEVYLTTG
ncbi:MAG: hypothetical protein GY710_06110 [Desulfobacteraceae bacterium]|nr:hypothetical protein [Desulfobacteraceae bacterium]